MVHCRLAQPPGEKLIAYINGNQTVADIMKAKREYEKQHRDRKIFSAFGT